MQKTEVNKNKIFATVFLILTIVAGITTVSTLVSGAVVGALSVYGFNCAKDMGSKPQQTPAFSQPSGKKVAFKSDRLDLGDRGDGCYYTVIRMVEGYNDPMDEGEFVILKKNGSVPSVKYFLYYPEAGQLSSYLIKNNLSTDDFSDMIDYQVISQNPQFFENRNDLIFTVIDMDSDILKTPDDYAKERDDRQGDLFARILGAVIVGFVSILGVILAIIEVVLALATFIAFILFQILFIVFLVKSQKEIIPEKGD